MRHEASAGYTRYQHAWQWNHCAADSAAQQDACETGRACRKGDLHLSYAPAGGSRPSGKMPDLPHGLGTHE